MSRAVSVALLAHLNRQDANSSALALCAQVVWSDATTTFSFTSWDRNLLIGSDIYLSAPGMSVSQVQGGSAGAVDSLEIKILPSAAASIVEDDILAGKWNGSTITLFLVNPEDLTQGRMSLMSGTLGNVTLDRGLITGEFLGLMQALQSTIGEIVTATCQNVFCGAIDSRGRGCGLDIADYTFTGFVTGWDPVLLVVDSADFTSYPNNQFNDGTLTFDDEQWITFGIRFFIQASGIIALKQAPPFPVTAGMAITVKEGCAKTIDVCIASPRANAARFRGFPHLKGNDKLLQTGRRNGS
jgi:uncharacterized phage protein (TIGR02218 family)